MDATDPAAASRRSCRPPTSTSRKAEGDKLFVLWQNYLPHRDALRATPIAIESEPTFIEKPTTRGGR